MLSNEDLLRQYGEIRQQRFDYCDARGIDRSQILREAKRILINNRTSSDFTLKKTEDWSDKDFQSAIAVLRYIYSEIYMLGPEQVDALWQDVVRGDIDGISNTQFLNDTKTKLLVDKIMSEAYKRTSTKKVLKDCLLNDKKFILKMLYPDYYRLTYNDKYDILNDVINAEGVALRDLKALGKSRSTSSHNKSVSMGNVVDELIKEGIEFIFNATEKIVDYRDKLTYLANAKKNHLNQLSIMKILNSRNCYASILDFYYLNSPEDLQREYFADYAKLRATHQKDDVVSKIILAYKDEFEEEYA